VYVWRNIFDRISPSFQPARSAIASSIFRTSVSILGLPVREEGKSSPESGPSPPNTYSRRMASSWGHFGTVRCEVPVFSRRCAFGRRVIVLRSKLRSSTSRPSTGEAGGGGEPSREEPAALLFAMLVYIYVDKKEKSTLLWTKGDSRCREP
jgi:hypothetical protein